MSEKVTLIFVRWLPDKRAILAPSSPTPAQQAGNGRGRSGLIPSLPEAHLDIGQYKNNLYLEVAQSSSCATGEFVFFGQKLAAEKKTALTIQHGHNI